MKQPCTLRGRGRICSPNQPAVWAASKVFRFQIAGITAQVNPHLNHKVIVVMAGDHGVTAEGVSAYPSEVTSQM